MCSSDLKIMKLDQLTIGLTAIALLQMFVPTISSGSKISFGLDSASASSSTDATWRKYLGGRKIVEQSSYSSGYGGGGGMRSKKEIHFCSDGQVGFVSTSSVVINVPGIDGSSGNDSTAAVGTWKITKSDRSKVTLELGDPTTGQKIDSVILMGQDGRAYNLNGKQLITTKSEACN